MRVIATITIDGKKETRIEGDSSFMNGELGDQLEQKGLGFWLDKWQYLAPEGKGTYHKGRVFVPWTSCLYVETKDGGSCPSKSIKKATSLSSSPRALLLQSRSNGAGNSVPTSIYACPAQEGE